MAKNTRALATLQVRMATKTNSIDTVQAYVFKPLRTDKDRYVYGAYMGAVVCGLVCFLLYFPAIFAAMVLAGAGTLLSVVESERRTRKLDCKNSYSEELPKTQAAFLRLYQLQHEVRRYMVKNIVPDLFVERFNNLTLRANQVYAYLTTPGLEPREDELMIGKAHELARGVERAFDELYADLIQQAELDPHVSKYGALVESMREFELRAADQEEQDYRELRSTYKQEIERTATDPRDYV